MKKTHLIIILISFLGFIACKNEAINASELTTDTEDYLIFGSGSFAWSCSAIFYKISDGKLYADTSKAICNREVGKYYFYQLPDSEYIKVNNILNSFPLQLSRELGQDFPCKQCADTGWFTLQRKEKGKKVKIWSGDATFLSENPNTLPKYLSDYLQSIVKVVPKIKLK
jgi:hypothetical protein